MPTGNPLIIVTVLIMTNTQQEITAEAGQLLILAVQLHFNKTPFRLQFKIKIKKKKPMHFFLVEN